MKAEGGRNNDPLLDCKGAITIDFFPSATQEQEAMEARDFQTELMQWYYQLATCPSTAFVATENRKKSLEAL